MAEAKLSDDAIIEIQNLWDHGYNMPEIQQKTEKSLSTIDKYTKAPRLRPADIPFDPIAIDAATNPPETNVVTGTPANTENPDNIISVEQRPIVQEQPVQQEQPVETIPPVAETAPVQSPVQQPVQAEVTSEHVQLQPTSKAAILPPYPEVPDPHIWLRDFLRGYRLKEAFIQVQSNRVQRRNELPHPSDLFADMKEMESGQKNVRTIACIMEDYDFEQRKFREHLANMNQPYMHRQGIPLAGPPSQINPFMQQGMPMYDQFGNPQQPKTYGGIPLPSVPNTPPQQYGGYPQQGGFNPNYPQYNPQQYPQQPPQPQGYPPSFYQQLANQPYPKLESELDRYAKVQKLFQKTEERNPVIEKMEKDNMALANRLQEMENDKKREMNDEILMLKNRELNFGNRIRELEEAKRNLEMQQSQKHLTEEDLRFHEIKDKHDLELRKLDEKTKTRETIASVVDTGFAQVGEAVARTLSQKEGVGEPQMIQGASSDGRHMWQANCPHCSTLITAPLSAKSIKCPGCGHELEVSSDESIPSPPVMQPTQSQPPIQYIPPKKETPDFQTEVPTPSVDTGKLITADCPHCHSLMSIPSGAKRVICPTCRKELNVDVGQNPIPDIPIKEEEFTPPPKHTDEIPDYTPPPQPTDGPPLYVPPKRETTAGPPEDTITPTHTADPPLYVPPTRKPVVETREEITKHIPENPIEVPIEKKPEVITEEMKEVKEVEKIAENIQVGDATTELQKMIEIKEQPIDIPIETPMPPEPPEDTNTAEVSLFFCPEPGCNKSFEKEIQLRGHMLHHSKKKKAEKKNK